MRAIAALALARSPFSFSFAIYWTRPNSEERLDGGGIIMSHGTSGAAADELSFIFKGSVEQVKSETCLGGGGVQMFVSLFIAHMLGKAGQSLSCGNIWHERLSHLFFFPHICSSDVFKEHVCLAFPTTFPAFVFILGLINDVLYGQ